MHIFKNISSSTKLIGVMLVLLSLSFESFGVGTSIEATLKAFEEVPLSRNKIQFHVGFRNYLKNSGNRYTGTDENDAKINQYIGKIANFQEVLSDGEGFKRVLQQDTLEKLEQHVDAEQHGFPAVLELDQAFKDLCDTFGRQGWFKDAVAKSKRQADKTYPILA